MNPAVRSRAHKLLRDKRFTSFLALFAIAVAAALTCVFIVDNFMVLTSANSFVHDWEVAYLTTPKPPDPRIVIVAVTEDTFTLKKFPYRSPLDRDFLNTLIVKLAAAHPRAIGVDYLFDQPTVAENDARLRQTLKSLKVPLFVAYAENPPPAEGPPIVTPRQLAYERYFVPQNRQVMVNLVKDQYGTVRSIFRGGCDMNGRYVDGFAWALARAAGMKTGVQPTCVPKDPKQRPVTWQVNPPDVGERPIVWHAIPSGAENAFTEIPAHMAGLFPAETFADKIVLIGSDESLVDRDRTPFAAKSADGNQAGITIHANALATLIDHEHWRATGWSVNFIVSLALAMLGGILGILNFHIGLRIAVIVGVLAIFWAGGAALYYYSNALLGLLAPSLAMVVSFAAMDSLTGLDARRQRHLIQGMFSRYLSPKVVEFLVAHPERASLEAERRVMTYLFTDIADFTTFSEAMDSRDLAELINEYLEGMTHVVQHHDGMVDKFIGDAVFAIFNVPVFDLPDHAERAVKCALDMDDFAEGFRKRYKEKGLNFGITRIGVLTGPAAVGNFGSKTRLSYTAQGDAVNAASRLEGLNKQFGTHICVSGETRALCKDIEFREIASVILKGKTVPTMVWEPLHPGRTSPELLQRYRAAFVKTAAHAPEAKDMFAALAADAPEDTLARWHAMRLEEGHSGTDFKMTEK